MSKRIRLLISTIAVLVFAIFYVLNSTEAVNGPARSLYGVAAATKPLSPELRTALDNFEFVLVDAFYKYQIPGLSVAVVKDSEVIYLKNFGTRDLDTGIAVDDNTVYRLASLSKGFAPVLTGILVQEGHLNWDDRVIDYLPDFKLRDSRATQQLTIRHILSHTTGLPRHAYTNLLNEEVPYEDILKKLSGVRLVNKVGECYNYQNVAYSLISDIILAATGRPYGELLQEKVFQPLGMRTASTGYDELILSGNFASPHTPNSNGYHRLPMADRYYSVLPAAGVNASITDMTKWLMFMMGDRPDVLADSILQEICTPQIGVSPRESVVRGWRPVDNAAYGLGWRIVDKEERRILYHGGFINGYRSEIGLCPEEGIGIVLLSNGYNPFMAEGLRAFFDLYFN